MTITWRRKKRFAPWPVCFYRATCAASLVIFVLSICFISNPAKAQKQSTPDQVGSNPKAVQKPAEKPVEKPDEKVAKQQRRTPLGTQVPVDSGLPTLRATASAELVSALLQRTGDAHSSQQLSSMNMVAEGRVTVYTASGPTALDVTLLRGSGGGEQGQRIFFKQADGKIWDGKGDHLTPEGRRALEFLETQNARGVRQFLESPKRAATITDNGSSGSSRIVTVQEKDGIATRYYLDRTTSRMTQFEFVRGQSRDKDGLIIPNVHSYAFSEFRSADGIATPLMPFLPFKVEHSINGVTREEVQWSMVQYNPAARNTAVRR